MRPPVGAPTLTRRTRILLGAAGVLVLLLLTGSRLMNLYVDWLWFGEVGFREVFTTVLFTRIVQFLIGAVLIGGLVALALWIAYRNRPVFVPVTGPEDPVARYRTVIIQRLRLFAIGIPIGFGLLAGLAAQGEWQTVQQFLNSTAFGVTDPEFGRDISFYAFQLPFYRLLLNWLFVGIAISFVVALVTHYIFGGIRLTGRSGQVSPAARAQLAVLAGVFVLLKAVAYYLDRFDLLYSDRSSLFTGATYTDLNAVMPARLILIVIAVVCAGAFFFAVFSNNLQVPAIATGLLILSSVLVGAAWPAVLQQFVVAPNANAREAESIERNIAATREAFGLTDEHVTIEPYEGVSDASPAEVADETGTIPNIRLLDPSKLSATFTQLQQRRTFYGFPGQLDIDRYEIDGELQDHVVAVRELDSSGLADNQQDWINRRLVYTHGNGLVVAPANRVNRELDDTGGQGGLPLFSSIDIQTDMETVPESLRIDEPRVYYGELIEGYSIVGAQEGAPPREYDTDTDRYTYTGEGGVPVGGLFNRSVFALLYGERNILFNTEINENSKIMYVRDPRNRVEQAAPWLTADSDPYPAVVDGRITWIVDAYTTLEDYPYSQPMSLGDVTADSLQQVPRLPDEEVSYLRNSVKATVDAYDGTVTLYAFDESDPVLQTWMKAFPESVTPGSEISDSLRSHFRYPADQFKVQRELYSSYHVDDPGEFFSNVSFWNVPSDPTVQGGGGAGSAQPPYYILAGQPGQPGSDATFQLTSPFVFQQREFLSAFMSVSSNPGNYGEITVLELPPENETSLGPQQAQTRFLGSPEVSQELNLLTRGGQTTIEYGNLLTLPVAGGLLYVEPVYIERANQESSYPQLARVIVGYGDQVGFDSSLAGALEQVFGAGAADEVPETPGDGQLAAPTPDEGGPPEQDPAPAPDEQAPPADGAPAPGGDLSPDAAAAAADIQAALEDLRAAQQAGDFGAQGDALAALDEAAQRFEAAQGGAPAEPAAAPEPGG